MNVHNMTISSLLATTVNTNFNALLVTLSRRYSNGVQFSSNYRLSKSIDTLSYEGPGFVTNLHYAMPALVIGMVGAAIALGPRRWSWVVPVAGWFVVATSIRPGLDVRVWAPEMGGSGMRP